MGEEINITTEMIQFEALDDDPELMELIAEGYSDGCREHKQTRADYKEAE